MSTSQSSCTQSVSATDTQDAGAGAVADQHHARVERIGGPYKEFLGYCYDDSEAISDTLSHELLPKMGDRLGDSKQSASEKSSEILASYIGTFDELAQHFAAPDDETAQGTEQHLEDWRSRLQHRMDQARELRVVLQGIMWDDKLNEREDSKSLYKTSFIVATLALEYCKAELRDARFEEMTEEEAMEFAGNDDEYPEDIVYEDTDTRDIVKYHLQYMRPATRADEQEYPSDFETPDSNTA